VEEQRGKGGKGERLREKRTTQAGRSEDIRVAGFWIDEEPRQQALCAVGEGKCQIRNPKSQIRNPK